MTAAKGKTMGSYTLAHRSRWACLILPAVFGAAVFAAAILWTTEAAGQPADASRLTFAVDAHRPLSALADEIEKRYPVIVTYEEAPWAASGDIEDVTQAVIAANGPDKAAPAVSVMVPRKAAVSFEYALDPAKGLPTSYSDLLAALLLQYEAAEAPGQFRVEGDGSLFHLIPARVKSADDTWTDPSPVLSTPVRLADAERSVDDTLDEIVAQLNESAPIKVGWGLVPLNLFAQTRIRLSADGVPAREVMHQILELLPRRVTWRLNYDPTTKRYYLSFLPLPGGR